ncbi:DUF6265 family protein [Pollutibacter soli]|uniref:DUF6265 family protein n=1 Tax=Pollutibacter soli TaxID=3034157 RepID=UPI0030137A50
MYTPWLIVLLLFVLPDKSYSQTNADHFKQLQKLSGLWSMETKKGLLYETWKPVSATEMISSSYRLSGNDTVFLEKVRLVDSGSAVYYIPVVSGQNQGKPVYFQLQPVVNGSFVFENREHDYPQRVIYKLTDADHLDARIEGTRDGKWVGSDFPYKKVR